MRIDKSKCCQLKWLEIIGFSYISVVLTTKFKVYNEIFMIKTLKILSTFVTTLPQELSSVTFTRKILQILPETCAGEK